MVLTVVLTTLAGLSLGLTVWQWLVAWRFPLHRRAQDKGFTPPVTLLKPLQGADLETARCLRSWFEQNYEGAVQILFGVASEDDPVCDVVRQLMIEHPRHDAQLIFCSKQLGANAKVSTLVHLERLARHETMIVSDADVLVPADFLRQLVLPLADSGVGLVHCFYRLVNPSGLAMRLEAFGVNADFWSQVLLAQALKPVDFALGAVMATSRAQLRQMGGFIALIDYLADDYQLGHRIAQRGARIALCPVVVECWSAPASWKEVWRHQLRWARTIRVCQPTPYFFSVLGDTTFWSLLWAISQPVPAVFFIACGCVCARMLIAIYLEGKMTRQLDLNSAWIAPLKDLLRVSIWALSFLGNQVTWRGQRLRVRRGGKIVKI